MWEGYRSAGQRRDDLVAGQPTGWDATRVGIPLNSHAKDSPTPGATRSRSRTPNGRAEGGVRGRLPSVSRPERSVPPPCLPLRRQRPARVQRRQSPVEHGA